MSSTALAFHPAYPCRYTHIQIVGQDDPDMLQKWRLSRAARLIRLRSTLRSQSLLAALVRTVHVPDPNTHLYLPDGDPNPTYDAYICTLASVVMACPNLEALTGFTPFYNHTFDRLTHALSTRTKLRQHVWIIAENDAVRERSQKQLPPGLLDVEQTFQFTLYHEQWTHLETLMLCSPACHGVIEHDLFVNVLHSLPSLKNLCVASFDADDFHNATLLSLPRITTLRLEECSGVTDAGLARWAASPGAAMVERLSLVHQNITSLPTLSKLFASLDRLTKFTVIQTDVTPSIPAEAGLVVFQPILASKTLTFLHWDMVDSATVEDGDDRLTPNTCLALSISHQGFPSLTHLRAPRDTSPFGTLQAVCRPFRDDTFIRFNGHPYFRQWEEMPDSNSLRMARLRAQDFHTRPDRGQGKGQAEPFKGKVGEDARADAPRSGRRAMYQTDSDASLHSSNTAESSFSTSNTDRTAAAHSHVPDRIWRLNSETGFARQSDGYDSRFGLHNDHEKPLSPPPPNPRRLMPSRPRNAPIQSVCSPTTASLAESQRPVFHLRPDVPGRDGNGGIVGWGELLKISEKAKVTPRDHDPRFVGRDNSVDALGDGDDCATPGWNGRQRMCTGLWGDQTDSSDQSEEFLPMAHTSTSSSATSAGVGGLGRKGKTKTWQAKARSSSKLSFKSKSTSSSILSLPLGGKASWKQRPVDPRRSRHIARPAGERGGCIRVEDFF